MDAAAKRRVSKIGQQLDENDRQGLCWGGVGGGWLKVGGGNGEAWLGGGQDRNWRGIVEMEGEQMLKRASCSVNGEMLLKVCIEG